MSRSKKPTTKPRRKSLLLESFEDRILCAAQPDVSLSLPVGVTDVKIGSAVDVTVRFDNVDPADTGYGPYADVFIKTTGADGAGAQTDDGLSLASATFLGTPVTTTTLTFDVNGQAVHPYARTVTGAPLVVDLVALGLYTNDGNAANDTFAPGDQMLVFQLPFGSTTPQQPAFDINMRLNVSNLADVGTALPIYARGGFQFGNDPLNNPTTDPSIVDPSFSTLSINPTVFTVTKYYTGYENTHTASITPGQAHGEIPTGPNFTQTYRIEVDIAAGQTISALNVRDILQNNMQFVNVLSVRDSGGGNLGFNTTGSTTSGTVPGGTMQVNLTNPVVGGAGTNDVVIEFSWFVPRIDSASAVIINATTGGDNTPGDDILTNNNVRADGSWTPLDVRDPLTAVSANDTVIIEGIVSAESLSVQKGATIINDVGAVGLSPGDVVEWTMNVEVSDYFAYNNLILSDLMSDGHRIDTTFIPTFAFNEHANAAAAQAIAAANWDVSQNFTGAVAGVPAAGFPSFTLDPAGNNGTTSITWRISNEMVTRGFNNNLTGGGIDSETTGLAGAPRNNPPMPWGGTTATIRFRTVVQDVYSDDFPSGDPPLDQGDSVSNSVIVSGNVLNVAAGQNLTPTGSNESDDGGASLTVAFQALQKTIYAINGNTNLAGVNYIRPGDSVTYRIQYTIPTGDIENFIITDYLPLPVFNTNDFTTVWNGALPADASVPGANVAKRGPNDTFTAASGINPTLAEPGGNAVSFNYGTYSDTSNAAKTIDILFTVVVNSQPFADALFLTNQAVETNNSTGNVQNTTTAIQQIRLGEPVVGIFKGVVGTNATGLNLGGIQFNAPGGATTFTGTLDSAADAVAIGANNAVGLDAQDTVRFAVIAQNTGHSDAFDVSLTDTIPAGYVIPVTLAAANFTVRRGDGTLLVDGVDYASTYVAGTWTVTLTDNYNVAPLIGGLNRGVDDAEAPITNGSNGIIITYDVAIAQTTQTGSTITNVATLTNYTNIEGGTDFTTTNLTNNATVGIVAPTIAKAFVNTEFTATGNSNVQAVIGEYVTYTVTVTVPEGTTSPTTVLDTLDAGLAFFDVTAVAASGGLAFAGGGLPTVGTTPANATIGGTGQNISFNLGTITNSNSSNGAAETITITYRAVVRNVVGNQGGTLLNNSANLTTATTNVTASAANITVVEPALAVQTQASANNITYVEQLTGVDALDTVYYRVRITNAVNAATAFELFFSETLPAATFLSGLSIFSVTDSSGAFNAADFELVGQTVQTIGGVASNKDVVAGSTIDIVVQGTLTTNVQAAQVLTSNGTIQWTSLDGTVTNRSLNNNTVNDEERVGTGGINDYTATDPGSIRIDPVIPVKTVVATSEASTAGTSVAVGEIVRYQLAIQVPEGTQTDLQLQDFIPAGMQFFNDGTSRVAFIANNAGTYSNPAGATLSLAITDAYRIAGSTVVTPLTTPTGDQVGATNSITVDNNTFTDGTDAFFKFGTIVNNDSDANAEYIVVEFNAIVMNVASNQTGTALQNGFQLMLNGVLVDSVATTTLTVAEPTISVAKVRTSAAIQDAGDTTTYTITVTNAAGANSTTAHNLNVRDLLDNDLTFVSATDNLARGSAGTSAVGTQTQLDYTISTLAPGESIVITVTATIDATASASEVIQNNSVVTWTSLAGTGTTLSGSTQGGAGTSTGERDATGGVNDYTLTTNTVLTTIAAPLVDKLTLTDTTWTIGDTVEFWINVTLPEGITENLTLTDVLPSGLTPLSYEVFAATSSAGTTPIVTSNFAGSAIATGNVNVAGGADGQDIAIALGNVTTTNDNNATNNNFLVRITTRVSDVPAASNGLTLTNQAQLSYRIPTLSASTDPVTGVATMISDSVNITVQEPFLQITKLAGDTTPNINQNVSFTLTITHAAGSTTTAQDIRVRDVLPAGMTLTSAVSVGGATVASDSTAGNTIDLILDSLAVGGTATLTFTARVDNVLGNVGATFNNNARIFWDTQAGDEATNSVFDNLADGTPDRDYGALFGNVEAFNATTDLAQDTERLVTNANSIAGVVYEDVNANGAYNAGTDTLINGVSLTLSGTTASGLVFSQTVLTVAGAYQFTNVPDGASYTITETQPGGYFDAFETVGTLFGGSISGTQGVNTITTIAIPADASQNATGYNFGEVRPASIGGFVYMDANNNGVFAGESAILSGVTVQLTGTDIFGTAVSTSTTTSLVDGSYSFINLNPGSYVVTELTQPAGFLDGRDSVGTNGGGTAGNETVTGITLLSGTAAASYNFGELAPASISGAVYADYNNNGVRNAGEAGIGGVTITLTGTNDLGNAVNLTTTTALSTGAYSFTNLRPSNGAGYTVTETQPAGFNDGLETTTSAVNNTLSAPNSAGTAGADVYTAVSIINVTAGNRDGVNYNFGEIPVFTATKSLTSSNQTATADPNLVIGEIARFRLVARVPVGTYNDVVLAERLPGGLVFVNDGTAAVSLVSATGALLTSSTIAGAGATTVGVPTTLLADAAISASLVANDDTYVSGTDVYFRLGNLTNNGTDAADEFVVIEFNARVTNELANQSGTTLANAFSILHDRNLSGTTTDILADTEVTSAASNLTVVEPRMALDKTGAPTTGLDAGDTVTYTITLTNAAANGATATAFDALILDAMPAGILITSINSVNFPVSVTQDAAVTITGGGTGLTGQFDIPVDATVTITYTGTLQTSVNPTTNYTNTATLTFTSINGVDANERNGVSPNLQGDGSVNDYRLVDTQLVATTNTLLIDKTTTATNVAVGDSVPYTLTLTVFEGTTTAVLVSDILPAGFQYVAGSAVVTPAAGITTGYVNEATSLTVAGANMSFNMGTIVNPAGGGNTVTITFNALVLDTAANASTTAVGQTKTNSASATGTGVPPTNDTQGVQFVEPNLVVTKGVDDATPDINQVVTFTVNVAHSATSSATAYDIRVRDLLPAGLTLDTVSLTITSGTATINGGSNITAGNQLDFTLNQLAVGESVTFTYQARVVNSLATVGTNQENNVRIYYDSQAGDEANNAILNNLADGTPDRDYGAVFGTTEAFNATTDSAQDTERLVVNTNSIAGVVYVDNNSNGVYNAGTDTPINGVNVRLQGTTNSGLPVDITLPTAGGGAYNFTGLPAGIYMLTETQPATYTDGLETVGSAFGGAAVISNVVGSNTMTGITIPTQGSTAATGYNFGETQASSVAGQVYRDFSNNGIVNAGELGINNVTITLTGTDIYGQAVNETFVTSGAGNYLFDTVGGVAQGLRPGNYTITETADPDLAPYFDGIDTPGVGGALGGVAPQRDVLTVALPQNTAATSFNFGELDHASISGFVFSDTDNNGLFNPVTESGINNVQVRLTGTDDRGTAVNILQTTPLSGAYSFTDLRPGNYTVTEVAQPSGYADGTDSIGTGLAGNGNGVGTVGNEVLSNINIVNVAPANNTGINYNFGEIFNTEITKTVVGSSESFTGPVAGTERVAIGEIVRYRLVVQAVEAAYTDFTIRDTLPAGMQFINDGSTTLALVSNGNLTSSFGFGGSQVVGSAPVTPTFQLSGNNISSDIANSADAYGSGGNVYFHLGNVSNTDNDGNSEYYVIEFNVQVLNEVGNQAGTTLGNTFAVLYDNNASGQADDTEVNLSLGAPTNVIVAESNIAISKALLSANPPIDAGDTVTYRITLTNNAAGNNATTAHNVRVLDLLDAIAAGNVGADLQLANTTLGSGIIITAPGGATVATNASLLSQLDLTLDRLNVGETVTIDIITTVVTAAPAGATLTNSVTAFATSLPGTGTGLVVNTNNGAVTTSPGTAGTANGERTGENVAAPTDNTPPANNAVLNNYAVGATIPVGDLLALNTPLIDKTFGTTSEAGTAGTNVAIGETVTFNITVTLPEGTTQGVIVTDNMQPGFEFLSAAVSFAGSGVTAFALPAPTVTGNSGVGTQLVYTLGDLANAADNNAANNTFVIAVTARVSDLPGNVSGVVRSNAANLQFTDPDGPGTGVPTVVAVADPNGAPSVTIVEPQLQIVKGVDDTTPDINQVVTYTLTLTHQGTSTSDGYDVRIRDLIPHGVGTGLILDPASITVNGVAVGTSPRVTNNSTAGDQLDLTLDQIGLAETFTITYQARVENTLVNVGTLLTPNNYDNNARIYWDSIAGDEATNAVFDAAADSTPDRDYGATPGVTEAHDGAVDLAQDGVRVTVNTNTITGVVYRDENVNGVFNDGVDERLNNVSVRLTGTTLSGLTVDLTQQTVNGDYAFTGLPAGTYVITETQPINLTDAVESVGTIFGGAVSNVLNADTITGITIPAQSATTGVSYNFGEVTPGSLAGSVYHDLDNDGVRDTLEIPLDSSVRLTGTDVYDEAVDITLPVTALGDGRFLFNNGGAGLRPGTYVLTQLVQPAGYLDGKETAGTSLGTANSLLDTITAIPLTQGTDATDYLFGEVLPSRLAGTVYVDRSNDGVLDAGELRIEGVRIRLSGLDDRGNPVNATFDTLADGTYEFLGLRPGNYTLTEDQPGAYSDGLDTAGTLGATVGNDVLSNITTTSGDNGTGYNFGERSTTLSGTVFIDRDRAGDLDVGTDTGLGGVVINLRDPITNAIIATTNTLPDGTYQFDDVVAGAYIIEEIQPLGYGSSTPSTLLNVTVPIGGLTGQNFGETLSTLAGQVFRDANNDGLLNGTDAGIGGTTIRLTGTAANGATVDRTTTTNFDGTYSFADLLSGTYAVRETQPTTFNDGIDTAGTLAGTVTNDFISNIVMPVATDATGYNFAEILPPQPPGQGAIRGTVFRDLDRDMTIGSGEAGIGLVTLQLLNEAGDVVATTTTSSDGSYAFNNLAPGTYSVRETQPNGFGSSTPNLIAAIPVVANQTVLDQNFGETTSGLAGRVFTDLDKDGVLTPGEPGISGVTLTLTGVDVNGASVSATTLTDEFGNYAFDGLIAGTYRIVETQPANRIDGLDHVGTSGGTAENDVLRNIALAADTQATGYNFGELLPSISGTVFRDNDLSGGINGTEPGIGNVTLTLRDNLNNIVATTTTNPDGTYEFVNVMPGTYTITETQPDGYGSSTANVINVPVATTNIVNQNFGETTGSLAGTVYRDVTAPNTLSLGDIGLGGVFVRLTGIDAQGNNIDTTITTNADGTYLFTGLLGGTYAITETQPSGFVDGVETVGTSGGDGNVNDVFSDIGLGNGVNATGYNFGETLTPPPGQGAITGTVWLDRDRDGLLEAGENGVEGVLVELYDAANVLVDSTFTGPDGRYVFNSVAPGVGYSIVEDQPNGYGSSTANTIAAITVLADAVSENNNFGETLGSLAGTVYRDANNDGVQLGAGETGIAGVTVTLSGFDINNNAVLLTTVTDANGDYIFNGLVASNATGYTVTETQPAGFNDGLDAVGSAGTTLGNDVLSGAQVTVTGDAVTDATEYNFGELGTTLSGNVWVDRNRDGTRDLVSEPNGVAGVLITLLDDNGDIVATTLTNAAGDYSFSNLAAGDYTIVQTQPNGYGSSTLNVINATVPLGGLIDQNFGETVSTIAGQVFRDDSQDSILNGPDRGIEGVQVQLTGTDANGAMVNILTATDANGNYQFIDLLEGNYTVTETQPADYRDFTDLVGSVGGLTTLNDRISSIGLGAAVDATDYDFAEIFRYDPTKAIVSTNNPGTSGNNLSVGETVRFRLIVALPDGTLNDFTLEEFLPQGLTFLNDGTVAVAFFSGSGNGLSSTTLAGAGLGTTSLNAKPTFLLSDAQISSLPIGNEDVYRSGSDVFFKLGNITNTETAVGDTEREFIILEFNARVGNEAANQNGRPMDNTFAPRFDLDNDNISDNLPTNIVSPPTRTVVAEPILALDKQITSGPKAPKPGDVITFTVTIGHAGDSRATAWESLFSDTLPSGMTVVSISTQGKNGAVVTKAASANGLSITGQFDIPVGGSVTITYQVRIGAAVKPGTTLTNGADITWTSMPGDVPTERKSGDSLLDQGGLNDYELVAKQSVKVSAPLPTGTPFFWDGFNRLGYPGGDRNDSPYPNIPFDNDMYRLPLLPLQPIYSGEADPGSTLVLTMFNTKGETIGTQTVVVDSGGNWLATFPSTTIRDYPNTVQISQLSAYYSIGSGVGHNLRAYYSPALNAGHFFFSGFFNAEYGDEAPLLADREFANPINSGEVKYHGEVLSSQGAARGY